MEIHIGMRSLYSVPVLSLYTIEEPEQNRKPASKPSFSRITNRLLRGRFEPNKGDEMDKDKTLLIHRHKVPSWSL